MPDYIRLEFKQCRTGVAVIIWEDVEYPNFISILSSMAQCTIDRAAGWSLSSLSTAWLTSFAIFIV